VMGATDDRHAGHGARGRPESGTSFQPRSNRRSAASRHATPRRRPAPVSSSSIATSVTTQSSPRRHCAGLEPRSRCGRVCRGLTSAAVAATFAAADSAAGDCVRGPGARRPSSGCPSPFEQFPRRGNQLFVSNRLVIELLVTLETGVDVPSEQPRDAIHVSFRRYPFAVVRRALGTQMLPTGQR